MEVFFGAAICAGTFGISACVKGACKSWLKRHRQQNKTLCSYDMQQGREK